MMRSCGSRCIRLEGSHLAWAPQHSTCDWLEQILEEKLLVLLLSLFLCCFAAFLVALLLGQQPAYLGGCYPSHSSRCDT